jgi:hypothetical protein
MLSECQKEEEYTKAFDAKGEYSAESLFMALIYFSSKNAIPPICIIVTSISPFTSYNKGLLI